MSNIQITNEMHGAGYEVPTQAQSERKLIADARVANATFRKGLPERMVIDAAIRSAALHAEMEALTHEQMVEQERNRRAVWDMIHGPLSATPSPDGCGCCGDSCKGRGSCRHADESPEPMKQAERQPRTDAQIVAQTEELAAELDRWRWGGVFEGITYRNNNATRARHCWEMACKAQEILTNTDPENAVAEVDGAQGAEGGAA